MTTAPVVGRIVLIRLAHAVIYHGVKDRNAPDHVAAFQRLQEAEESELLVLPREKRESAARHARKAADAILGPFRDQNVHAAAFGLALVYVLQELANEGLYEPNEAFAEVLERGLMDEDGTLVERHNSDLASAAAVKMGRKLLSALQGRGYFIEQVAA